MIQPTSPFSGHARTNAATSHTPARAQAEAPTAETGERLSRAQTDTLQSALKNTPEVRSDVVARGKALAADPTWPPRQIIEQLTKLIVESRDE